jgi:predicted MFS family arabinose efflux permease
MQVTPSLVHRLTSAVASRAGAVASAAALLLIALAHDLAALTACLVVLGVSLGTLDIAMNTQGVALERGHSRPILSSLHGIYNIGVLAGSGCGALAGGLDLRPLVHFSIAACALTALTLLGTGGLLGREADAPIALHAMEGAAAGVRSTSVDDAAVVSKPRLTHYPSLIVIGLIGFSILFGEGAVDNWSGVFLHQVRHSSFGVAPLGTAGCAIGMAAGRFAAGTAISRYGEKRTLLAASLFSAAAMTFALLANSIAATIAGLCMFGFGAAPVAPLTFSLAGKTPGVQPAWALSRVTAMGYMGQLTSPAVIGVVAGRIGLTSALGIAAGLPLLITVLVPLIGTRRSR